MASLDRKAINLGCDGGSSLDSLLLLTSGSFSIPPVVVIEANVLESDSLSLHGITQSAWFRCGRRFPLVSAAYRPSSLLFQRLKERGPRHEKLGEDKFSNWTRFTEVPRIPESVRESTAVPERKYSRVIELINQLKNSGCRIMVVWIPNGRGRGDVLQEQVREAQQMAATCGVLFFDMRGLDELLLVDYTDNVHLNERSAKLVVQLIERQLSP